MKKTFYITALAVFGVNLCSGQLFSSGNNVIAGTNVGIGINAPLARLDVANELRVSTNPANGRFYRIISGGRQEVSAFNDLITFSGQNNAFVLNNQNGTANGGTGSFFVTNGLLSNPVLFRVDGPTGNVTVGNVTTPAGYKLYVETGILTEKLKVAVKTSASWSDYVFEPGYNLKPLSEVEAFVKTNKHLPGVPSAKAMVTNGLDVATMDAKLLEKIEELTLYMIEIKKENELLKKQIQSLLK